MDKLFAMVCLSVSLLFAFGCRPGEGPGTDARVKVTVSILPQRYFVEQVGGEHVAVNVMVLPGQSPATYEPSPEQMRELSGADMYVTYGAPFEDAWLGRIQAANPDMAIVDSAVGVELITFANGVADPHIFLSPRAVAIQAENIARALAVADPSHEPDYRDGLQRFKEDIDALDMEIAQMLSGFEGSKFLVFHPAWGYFARDYNLEMVPVEIGGQEPSAAELVELVTLARDEGIKVIFVQEEFSTRMAEVIADEIDGEVLQVSVLSPDWLDNMRQVADTFADVFTER